MSTRTYIVNITPTSPQPAHTQKSGRESAGTTAAGAVQGEAERFDALPNAVHSSSHCIHAKVNHDFLFRAKRGGDIDKSPVSKKRRWMYYRAESQPHAAVPENRTQSRSLAFHSRDSIVRVGEKHCESSLRKHTCTQTTPSGIWGYAMAGGRASVSTLVPKGVFALRLHCFIKSDRICG